VEACALKDNYEFYKKIPRFGFYINPQRKNSKFISFCNIEIAKINGICVLRITFNQLL